MEEFEDINDNDDQPEPVELPQAIVVKRGRGRPKGAKDSKPRRVDGMTSGAGRQVPPTPSKDDDFAHADVDTLLSRQLSMLSWQQQAMRWKMMGGQSVKDASKSEMDFRSGGKTTYPDDTKELLDLSNAITRAIDGMGKYKKMAKELAAAMTAEELLEAALMKIEGQSLPTLNYAIKRLRAKRESLAPVLGLERIAVGKADEEERAVDAIGDLMREP